MYNKIIQWVTSILNNMNFHKPNRKVNKVFLHASASDNPDHDDVSVIRKWHLEQGWSDVGYHFFITKNGNIQKGRDLEQIPAAQIGYNINSIAICLHGLNIDLFTDKQFNALKLLCYNINIAYNNKITFHGHNEVNKYKTCPVYDYKRILNLNYNGFIV